MLRSLILALAPQASRVDVVAATPLPGTDLPLDEIPAPVQTATARDLEQSGSLDLSDLLNQRLSGVHINQNQENPFQPDVNYRGYTASPLLGTPEGISVYMDGVRQNQPFGDIVAWDLIPKIAISEVALMPGSNPLFGLNTLGGAVSIRDQGRPQRSRVPRSQSTAAVSDAARASLNTADPIPKGLSWYVAGNLFREDGWREHSPLGSPPGVRQAGMAARQNLHRAQLRLRRQLADRQRSAGFPVSGDRITERLQHSRYHLEPLAVPQSQPAAQR